MNLLSSLKSRTLAVVFVSALTAALALPASASAEKAPTLPVKTAFGKGTPGDNGGPYALTVTNTSKESISVNATITWSVTSHNRPRQSTYPAQVIAAGKSITINDLATGDAISLTADGFAALDVVTPPGKMGSTMPVKATFGKGTPGDNGGPYALTLTNTSKETIVAAATITWSVTSHNRPMQTALPAQEIASGGEWVINDLAAGDKIAVAADGYATLQLVTPPGK